MITQFRRPESTNRRPRNGHPFAAGALTLLTGSLLLGVASASRIDDAASAMPSLFVDEAGAKPAVVRCLLDPVSTDPQPCAATILVEAETGTVLYEQDADEPRAPASLVKMMLQLLVLQDIDEGKIAFSDSIETSANASTMGGSQVFLKEGERQTLGALLQAVAISSANDAAMAIAEHVAGTEEAFVAIMNAEAERLGCTGTEFTNVHGLDLWGRSKNVTTARDMATIARALVKHEHALSLSSTWRAPFRDGAFWLDNTNRLLRKYGGVEGLDGLKTGYTWRAGGCFCGTAMRDGVRLLSVVMGARPGRARFLITRDLLEAGFEQRPVWHEVARGGEKIALAGPVVTGPGADHAMAVTGGSVRVIVEDDRREAVQLRIRPFPGLAAPVDAGDPLGYLDCRIDDRTFASVPVAAADEVRRLPADSDEVEPLGGRPRPAKGVL